MTKRSSWLPLAVGVVLLGGAAAALTVEPSASSPATSGAAADVTAGQQVPVDVGGVSVVCPPGTVTPADVAIDQSAFSAPEAIATWAQGSLQPLSGGGAFSVVPGEAGVAGLAVAGTASGDLLSFAAQSCQAPATSLAFAAGATVVGEDTALIISNPGDKAVTAELSILESGGSVLESPVTLAVPAASTITVLPGTWGQDLQAPVFWLQADGNGVAAWLQSSGLDGEVPLGVGRMQGTQPAPSMVIPGISAQTPSTLRIGNLGSVTATVQISLMTEDGEVPLEGAAQVPITALSSVSLDLSGLPSTAAAVWIRADHDVVAAVEESFEGVPHPDVRDADYVSRTLIGPGGQISEFLLADVAAIEQAAAVVGFQDATVAVAVANSSAETAELEIQGLSKTLAPGASAVYPLQAVAEQASFASSQPVNASYVVTVSTPAGMVTSVAPVGVQGLAPQSRLVVLVPDHRG